MFKNDPAVISHIMYMIDMDIFWHQKTFEAVLAKLQRNHDEKVNEQDVKTKNEKEVIDLCDESQTMTSDHWKDKQERKQNNHDKKKSETVTRKANRKWTRIQFRNGG